MSLFKKPKRNIRKRIKGSDSEDEVNNEDNDVNEEISETIPFLGNDIPVEVRPKARETSEKREKEKNKSANTLLSFADEEEDGDVFKVKKSSHSRRLARQREKEKKKKQVVEKENVDYKVKGETTVSPNLGAVPPYRPPTASSAPRKEKEDNKIVILNGDEADQMELDSDSQDEDDEAPRFDPVRKVLESGEIPDAAMIHAVRKRRQMAREMKDFVPIDENREEEGAEGSSRLVRDDDHDRSDEDEEGRLNFTVNTSERDRQKARESFYPMESGGGDEEEEVDEEIERWEQEQIRKGVSIPQPSQQVDPSYAQSYLNYKEDEDYQAESIPVIPKETIPQTTEAIKIKLKKRLESLREVHRAHKEEVGRYLDEITYSEGRLVQLEKESPAVAKRFAFYQEVRGYVTDLVECLNEKALRITVLEENMHDLLKQRSSRLIQRRQEDVKDQCQENSISASRLGASNPAQWMAGNQDEARVRRAAEREGRRTRRRKRREGKGQATKHYDGMSSDDEEVESDLSRFSAEKERILAEAACVFEDVEDSFCQLPEIKRQFERWKSTYPESYADAYVSLCLPKIFNPFIRLELLSWSPLEGDCELEDFRWFESLTFYSYFPGESTYDVAQDLDRNLIPLAVEKVVLPKITFFVEFIWDPVSTNQTLRVSNLIRRLIEDYPTINNGSKNTKNLLEKIVNRIKKSLDDDVYVPLYQKSILENKGGPSVFFQRQFWSCVKLLRNTLSWQGIVSDSKLQELALDGLLNRAMMVALHSSPVGKDMIDKCKMIVATLPRTWFAALKSDSTMPQLENFCKYLKNLAEHADRTGFASPMEGKKDGREQIKDIITLLVNIGAMNHAMAMAKQFSLKELKQLVSAGYRSS